MKNRNMLYISIPCHFSSFFHWDALAFSFLSEHNNFLSGSRVLAALGRPGAVHRNALPPAGHCTLCPLGPQHKIPRQRAPSGRDGCVSLTCCTLSLGSKVISYTTRCH